MKRILIGTMAVMMTVPCFAVDGDNVLTSKPYVDDAVSTRQDKIPAANPSNTNLGETVMTYTPNGNGEIGERELFTGGPYDAANDADKLITASALKSAFTLPETQTTKLVCANPGTCDLWTITNQTAYGISGNGTTTIDLASIMGMSQGTDNAYRNALGLSDNASTYGVTQNMTWVVDYGNGKRIRGKAQCSSRGVSSPWTNSSSYTFGSDHFASTLPDARGEYCYCQLDGYTTNGDNWGNMTALSAPWVFYYDLSDFGASACADACAQLCANGLWSDYADNLAFRAAMFNSVQ